MKTLYYTVAKDGLGSLILANDAEKGNTYWCTECNGELIFRKSGNTGKNSKRPHFAHKILSPNCTPESALHRSFKTLVKDEIENQLTRRKPIHIRWNCDHCSQTHTGELLKKAKAVKLEFDLGPCRPDIALFDANGNVFAIMEIIVTHEPEQYVWDYCAREGITLVRIALNSDQDVYRVKELIRQPTSVELCTNPRCKQCLQPLHRKMLLVVEGSCYQCDQTMKIATIHREDHDIIRNQTNVPPSRFTQEEIAIARMKGVLIKQQYSKTAHDQYLGNTCPHCNALAGNFYLYTQYISPASYGELPSLTYPIGYECACGHTQTYDMSRQMLRYNLSCFVPKVAKVTESLNINWQKLEDQFNEIIQNRKVAAAGSTLTVETNLYDHILQASAGNGHARQMLDFFDQIFGSLDEQLSEEEIALVKKSIINILQSFDHKYLNFLGELAILDAIKKSGPYQLETVEYRLDNGKSIDFKFRNTETGELFLVEVFNIHLDIGRITDDPIELGSFLKKRLEDKMNDKRQALADDVSFTLAPVIWGNIEALFRYRDYFQSHKPEFANVHEPMVYTTYGPFNRWVHKFVGISRLPDAVFVE